MISGCSHIFANGPNAHTKCNDPVTNNSLCDRCNARGDLIFKLNNEDAGAPQGQCTNLDPYNGDVTCNRRAVYRGYCLLCLSLE